MRRAEERGPRAPHALVERGTASVGRGIITSSFSIPLPIYIRSIVNPYDFIQINPIIPVTICSLKTIGTICTIGTI